ncbi:unnamed protein product [Rotaria magnacalcarata]|uniref:Uncharacterized protein n=1 Tax=Rotaria magnacalcarata TaxID=392030 RepID=A0A8S3BCP3_9BILA|nr:unnamed protein product [Rotaria magnacalcarata]
MEIKKSKPESIRNPMGIPRIHPESLESHWNPGIPLESGNPGNPESAFSPLILRFPNLKSIVLTRCFLIESLIKSLSVLIKHQLNELVLTFDEDVPNPLQKCNVISFTNVHTEKILIKFDELIRQLFSNECRLTSLRLDFASIYNDIDYLQCLKPHDNLSSGSMSVNKYKFRCSTLHRLHIHITHICFCVLEK